VNWTNVRLILVREIRDQLRDRRTLFVIAVLPVLLYPLMGISLFQLAQFLGEHGSRVYVVGAAELIRSNELPVLFTENGRFSPALWPKDGETAARLLEVELASEEPTGTAGGSDSGIEQARDAVLKGKAEVAVYFPPDFVDRMLEFRARLMQRGPTGPGGSSEHGGRGRAAVESGAEPDTAAAEAPGPIVFYNTARETSEIALARVDYVLARWKGMVTEKNLRDSDVPAEAVRPFQLAARDVAEPAHRDAATWAKVLPFMLLIWALTGAFYPAIDLCAGEKERGTLETLLSSPVARGEIVVGKLLTVMAFSMATSALNLASLGLTGMLLVSSLSHIGPVAQIGMPPWTAAGWLALALVPVSALFSALSLALAAFARSTKEGQYYLMPLILISLPLMMLPLSPTFELNFGNALIPVTGLMLLLRESLSGNYQLALWHVPPVTLVTGGCCVLAVRWAIEQFNQESVLFREGERLDLGLWLRRLVREREETPTAAMAVACAVLILVIWFFTRFAMPAEPSPREFLTVLVSSQMAFIAAPALLMTAVLTRSPRKTLLMSVPPLGSIPASALLALGLHPIVMVLHRAVQRLYPLRLGEMDYLRQALVDVPIWAVLAAVALVPAVCEELAFRGFILSGLRRLGRRRRAVLISSLFFAVTHMIFQQSVGAFVVGLVLGYLAVQTGSLLSCVLFHATHNGLTLLLARLDGALVEQSRWLSWLFQRTGDEAYLYSTGAVALGGLTTILVMQYLQRLPATMSREEALQASIDLGEPQCLTDARA
jgi:sodium transport system permease protein